MGLLQLMSDNLVLFASICVLIWTVTYIWWIRARDMLLRQELFSIRDRLWDEARRLDAFDDEAYREARQRLNDTIRISRWITIPSVALFLDVEAEPMEKKCTKNQELQTAIDNAYREAAGYICHHLMRHTLSGLTILSLAFAFQNVTAGWRILRGIKDFLANTVGRPLDPGIVIRWLWSSIPAEMANDERVIESGGTAHALGR